MQSDTYQIQVDISGLKRALLIDQERMHPVCFMLSEIVASACSHSHRQGYKQGIVQTLLLLCCICAMLLSCWV